MNQYGYFNDSAREYIITRPDTPLPWLNYLGQDEFFGLCSNTAGGYTFWKDAKMRRLTRYRYNNSPLDNEGRYLYVKHGDTVWNPGWKPVKTRLDKYECCHGLGYTRLTGEKNGIEVSTLYFVPSKENLEIWKTTVKNKTGSVQTLQLFSYQEFCFFEAENDMTNYQRTWSIGEVEVDGSAIYHKTEYRERRNHYTLFACTRPVDGFDTDRFAFVGVHNGMHDPKAVLAGAATNSVAHGYNPIGSHMINLTLEPGQEETFSFILAYVEQDEPKFSAPKVINKQAGQAILQKYSSIEAVDAAFAALNKKWDELLGVFVADCPNEHAMRMVNIWNPVQCMATFNMSRSASGYETGIGRGMGFRDSNQDLLGFVHMIPERARERLLDIARTQMQDGSCWHQYQPLTKKGNDQTGSDFNDDPLWLVLSTCSYIKESGDTSILDEQIGYADVEGSKDTVLHHLETSLKYTRTHVGPHGLPLIGHADWNDCLNLNCFSTEPNESFQQAGDTTDSVAESVMIAGLYLYACQEMKALYTFLAKPVAASTVQKHYDTMLEAVETNAWDGEWYRRAYDAFGKPVGSKACEEGKIFIESQGWCLLGGAGKDNGRARQSIESVHQHLFTPNGIILQQPAFSEYHVELGEISSYPPGYKENDGIFSHNNTWMHIALCQYGLGDRAFEYYLSICPSARQENIDDYKAEPYVYSQMIAGRDAAIPGEAKNSWLTGTAAWSYVSIANYILGVRADYDGLKVDPCIPKDWDGFSVTRNFRGKQYKVTVKNPYHVCKGVASMVVNGESVEGDIIALSNSEEVNEVVVTLG